MRKPWKRVRWNVSIGRNNQKRIFYPWMDRNFSISQNGEVFTKFNEADERLDILFQNMKSLSLGRR